MKKILLLLFCFACLANAYGQHTANENKVWAFGFNAGVRFTTGTPVPFSSVFNATEGGASVADAAGNLLFYTDGKRIWNRMNAVMPSASSICSYATSSCSQSSLIVQVVGNADRYYVFSQEAWESATPGYCNLTYTVVDMTLAGGMGDAIPALTNIPLANNLSEKLIAVPGNNCNIWVIAHKRNAPEFLAYEITAAGINTTPVVSTVGVAPSDYQMGVLKVSADKLKLAMMSSGNNRTELYDFNPTTGTVSNCRVLSTTKAAYGAEFSPDNTRLYTSTPRVGTITAKVYQYDISLPTAAAMAASEYLVATSASTINGSDLKLGPDNKIYLAGTMLATSLDCISNPNLVGSACGLTVNAVNIAPRNASLGLPNLFWAPVSIGPGTITGNLFICIGATTALTTGTTGTWGSSTPSIATVGATTGIVTGIAAGTSVISFSNGSCYTTAVVTVTPLVPSSTGSHHLCIADTTTLINSIAGGKWSTGNSAIATADSLSGVITGVSAGTATITYRTAPSCFSVTIVTVHPGPQPITGPLTMCAGLSTTLANANPGGTWSSGNAAVASVSGTGIVSGLAGGTAVITYTLPYCGMSTAIVTVNPSPGPISGPLFLCTGYSATLYGALPGGIWSSGTPSVATISGAGVITGLSAGTSGITYTLGGCFAVAIATVNAALPPISGELTACVGRTFTLHCAAPGGTWASGNTAVATIGSASGIGTGIAAGTAEITYSLGNGCSTTTVVAIGLPPDAGTITGPAGVCPGNTMQLASTMATGTWSGSNANAIVSASGSVTGLSSGTATVTYTVTNSFCSSSATKVVTVHPLPAPAAITGPATLCLGAQVHLTPTIGGGTWLSGNTAVAAIGSANGEVSCTGNGTTVITYTTAPDANGCTAFTTFTLSVTPPLFTINAQVAHISCYGAADGSITLSVPSAATARYAWSTGAITPGIGSLVQGIYTVSVTDTATQCTRTAGYTINEPDSITLSATATADTCNAGQGMIITDASGGTAPYAYAWSSNSSATATAANLSAGLYMLTLTDANGCKDTISATVPEAPCRDIVVHDVITPNGDGLNDQWVIQQINRYPRNTVQIFDKWGDKVYEKQGYNNEWSGQATSGSNLPDGVYYYIVKLNENNHTGGENEFAGTVMIKR